ncbi:MAG: pyrroline-5-carboxylate reductase [Erythrobacter sp.]
MNILLVGCGKMGGALLENWMRGDEAFAIVDPQLDRAPQGVSLHSRREEVADRRFDVIVAAIKPQMIDQVMPDYSSMFTDDGYLLSIAAGCSIARLQQVSGGRPVIRVMPNLPAAIGAGVSALCASADASEAQIGHARAMMERTGTVITVEDEDAIDRFTAVAGSGPGYVFELARAYTEAAIALGFDEAQARAMVIGTLQGTIAMAAQSGEELETLRDSVTSKGGTTAAGLTALNGKGELSALLSATLEAAYDRAVELR